MRGSTPRPAPETSAGRCVDERPVDLLACAGAPRWRGRPRWREQLRDGGRRWLPAVSRSGPSRFSVSWPRVQPTGRGAPNQRGLDFYWRLVDGLHARGIAPMLTLFHWDLPQRLQDDGGWEARDCAKCFADYASIVFRALGDGVPVWLTINEPKTIVNVGYIDGAYAPGRRDRDAALVVAHHLLLAHGLAVQAYRQSGFHQRIGPALNLAPVYPAAGESARSDSCATTWLPRTGLSATACAWRATATSVGYQRTARGGTGMSLPATAPDATRATRGRCRTRGDQLTHSGRTTTIGHAA
jgi:hypothetical protein